MITARPAKVWDLPTPALLVDGDALEDNIAVMAAVLPGERLRPHVKAHKCTGIARRQAAAGHRAFTCATIRECEGMAAAGLGSDLLLANEVLDATRLGDLVRAGSRVTLAVDSPQTIAPRRRPGCTRSSSTSTSACRAAAARRATPGGWPTRPGRRA